MKEITVAKIQAQFEKFHENIKMDKETLRKTRETLLDKIKISLKEKKYPVPELLNQGSYIYGVGIKPISSEYEYDIDVGLVFDINSDDYTAKEVREWVFEAIKDHTKIVVEKGPCIRVHYQAGYHVDLICYAKNFSKESENYKFAHKDNTWKESDPKALKQYIKDKREKFSNTYSSGADQLQRIVRYFKRWNDNAIPQESSDKPSGLALLLLCIKYLHQPKHSFDGQCDDLSALKKVCESIPNSPRISVKKPTPECEDVFGKLSEKAMDNLKIRIESLLSDLINAQKAIDPVEACKILRDNQFGKDFPVPESKNTSKKTSSPAIITTSSSA